MLSTLNLGVVPTPQHGLAAEALPRARHHVLFVAVDDLRYQLGVPDPRVKAPAMHTPSIDRLARRSLLLERNYAQQALCSPSRTSVLTGRRPEATRVWDLRSFFRSTGGNYTTL